MGVLSQPAQAERWNVDVPPLAYGYVQLLKYFSIL